MKKTDTQAQAALRYAARNPNHLVLLARGSTQGTHLWIMQPDGGSTCVAADSELSTRPTRREIKELLSHPFLKHEAYTHVVLVSQGKRYSL